MANTTKTRVIFVSIIPGTTELMFKNKGGDSGREITTDCECGDTIKWKIRSKGLVICGIPMKPNAPNIWAEGGKPKGKPKGTWFGIICETAAGKKASYSVSYTINGGRVQEQDPDIDVHGDDDVEVCK